MTYDAWYAALAEAGLNDRQCRALATDMHDRRVEAIEDFAALDDAILLQIPNIGRRTVRMLKAAFGPK